MKKIASKKDNQNNKKTRTTGKDWIRRITNKPIVMIIMAAVIIWGIWAIIASAKTKARCDSYTNYSEVPSSDYIVCKEQIAKLLEAEKLNKEECSAKGYEWNEKERRCNTDEEQESLVREKVEEEAKRAEEEAKKAEAEKSKAEELAKQKAECENKPYYTWNGSSCTAETWTKELGWNEVENNQCYVDAVYDKMDDRYGNSFDILGHSDGLGWSATEYYSGGTLTKTEVYFGYKFLKSGNLHMAKCEIKNCKCSSLESKG